MKWNFLYQITAASSPLTRGIPPPDPVLSVLNWICWTPLEQNSWVRHWCQVNNHTHYKTSIQPSIIRRKWWVKSVECYSRGVKWLILQDSETLTRISITFCGQRGVWWVVSNYYYFKITKPQPVLRNLQGSSWCRWWVLRTRLLNSYVP
jgi:hypothetical protein